LSSRNSSGPQAAVKSRIFELERIIGKQTVQNEIKKKFSVRPAIVSLICWLKDSGYPVTALGAAWGWQRATLYRRRKAGQGAGSPALKFLGSITGPANNEPIWIEYGRILAGPEGAHIGQLSLISLS
jgi:hypothetical protein